MGNPEIPVADWNAPAAIALPGVVAGAVSLAFIIFLQRKIQNQNVGKDINLPVLDKLAAQIRSGSIAFLSIEYKYLSLFVVGLGIILTVLFSARPISKER